MSYSSPYILQLKQARDAERMAAADRAHQRKMLWEQFGANALGSVIGTGLDIGKGYAMDYTDSAKAGRALVGAQTDQLRQAQEQSGYNFGRKKFDDSVNDRARDINAGLYGNEIPGGSLPDVPQLPRLGAQQGPLTGPADAPKGPGVWDKEAMRKAAVDGMRIGAGKVRARAEVAPPPSGLGAGGAIRPPPKMPSAIDLNETLPPSTDDKVQQLAMAKVQAERAAAAEAARQRAFDESAKAAEVGSRFQSKSGRQSWQDYQIKEAGPESRSVFDHLAPNKRPAMAGGKAGRGGGAVKASPALRMLSDSFGGNQAFGAALGLKATQRIIARMDANLDSGNVDEAALEEDIKSVERIVGIMARFQAGGKEAGGTGPSETEMQNFEKAKWEFEAAQELIKMQLAAAENRREREHELSKLGIELNDKHVSQMVEIADREKGRQYNERIQGAPVETNYEHAEDNGKYFNGPPVKKITKKRVLGSGGDGLISREQADILVDKVSKGYRLSPAEEAQLRAFSESRKR